VLVTLLTGVVVGFLAGHLIERSKARHALGIWWDTSLYAPSVDFITTTQLPAHLGRRNKTYNRIA
jgi:hypothetical protein